MNYHKHIPCGETLPLDNPHAVSVSLPRLADVIGYEEKYPDIRKSLKSGYPRFVANPFLTKTQKHLCSKFSVDSDTEVILISSPNAANRLFEFLGSRHVLITDGDMSAICISRISSDTAKIQHFLQHTGSIPSSRMAEQYLLDEGAIFEQFQEPLYASGDALQAVTTILASAYGVHGTNDVLIGNCGMNAVFASYCTLRTIQKKRGRGIFIRFGWLYLDTIEIIKKLDTQNISIESVVSQKELEAVLAEKGDAIAGIFTEVATNPLVQTPDLAALKKMADRYEIPVVVDATMATPYNVDVVPYVDIIVESLTKFACGNADLTMGAVIVNRNSSWYHEIQQVLPGYIDAPFLGDLQRLALEIQGYEARIKKINENTLALVGYLGTCKKVKEIYWPYQKLTKDNYASVQKHENAAGGVISVVFEGQFEEIYNRINLPKGPSFGTEFTLLMPYMYLAHYDLVSTPAGRRYLKSIGIHPDLLRISVGMEDVNTSIDAFKKVLD